MKMTSISMPSSKEVSMAMAASSQLAPALAEPVAAGADRSPFPPPSVPAQGIPIAASPALRGQLVSVIIPVYNEEAHVGEVLRRILAVDFTKELVVVDDGSTDGTRAILAQWERHPDVRIIYAPQNRGKGTAIRLGLREIVGEIVVVHDADLEYDSREMLPMLELIAQGRADVVYGSRFLGSVRGMKFQNWVANRLLAISANLLFRANITDEATAYKAFRTAILRTIKLNCTRFEFCPEVTAKVRKKGYKIVEVPIHYEGRTALQGKKIKLSDGFEAFWTLLKYRFRD